VVARNPQQDFGENSDSEIKRLVRIMAAVSKSLSNNEPSTFFINNLFCKIINPMTKRCSVYYI